MKVSDVSAANAGVLVAVLLMAAVLRIYRVLSIFPILVDESIYLRWAEIIDHQGQWFVSLLDGKQPFSYWIYALIRKCLPESDPLLGGRLVSGLAGVVSAGILFHLGQSISGAVAGLTAAFFYALLPYGVFYERLAYTDALVNCFGLAIAAMSINCFRHGTPSASKALILGGLVSLGLFTKTTVASFALLPAIAGFLWQRRRPSLLWWRLAQIYAVAPLLPGLSYFMMPDAPTFATTDLFLHRTNFFAAFEMLRMDPLVNARNNAPLMLEYLWHYVTPFFGSAALIAICLAIVKRDVSAALVLVVFVLPLVMQIFLLGYFPSRYVFPHVWPLVLATAVLIGEANARLPPALIAIATGCLVFSLFSATATLLSKPDKQLHWIDTSEFLASGPFSGYGIAEAVSYLRREAIGAPSIILTDPIWGTPADAIHAYLDRRSGTRVYDAWWIQLSETEPLLPAGQREIMKSQYERVANGVLDFDSFYRVFYVTDTNYNTQEDVLRREPNARLSARFLKPNLRDSIDVYQLR